LLDRLSQPLLAGNRRAEREEAVCEESTIEPARAHEVIYAHGRRFFFFSPAAGPPALHCIAFASRTNPSLSAVARHITSHHNTSTKYLEPLDNQTGLLCFFSPQSPSVNSQLCLVGSSPPAHASHHDHFPGLSWHATPISYLFHLSTLSCHRTEETSSRTAHHIRPLRLLTVVGTVLVIPQVDHTHHTNITISSAFAKPTTLSPAIDHNDNKENAIAAVWDCTTGSLTKP